MARVHRGESERLEALKLGPVFGVRPLPSSFRLRLPPQIELVTGPPRYAEPFPLGVPSPTYPAIAWAFDEAFLDRHGRDAEEWPRGAPVSTLLRDFRKLVTATDEEILAFARTYGVLGVCPHARRPIARQWHGRDGTDCEGAGIWGVSEDRFTVAIEPIETWRLLARQANAILSVREHLSAGLDAHAPGAGVLWKAGLDDHDHPELPGCQKHNHIVQFTLGDIVTKKWLWAALLVPEIRVDPTAADEAAFTTVLVPRNYPFSDRLLFPILAQQLAGVITHPKRVFTCGRCNAVFYPEKRAPQEHRENHRPLCAPCKPLAKREKQIEAKRRQRASRTVSNPVSDDNSSATVSARL